MFFRRTKNIRIWNGRYARIPGVESVFRVRWNYERKDWWVCLIIKNNLDKYICWALEDKGIRYLTKGVNDGKRFLINGHPRGGSFLINEYGQVLVPSSDGDDRRVIVGEISGDIWFNFKNSVFNLRTIKNTSVGAVWDRPYIGIPYNLSAENNIYFKRKDYEGIRIEYLNKEYEELIQNLRRIRPYGAVKFIVNPYGIVLTKKYINNNWMPVFVQKLDYKKWFKKEEV